MSNSVPPPPPPRFQRLEHLMAHIFVFRFPLDEQVRYIGKTEIPTQNVLAVCDFDMRFTCVNGPTGFYARHKCAI